MSESGIETDFTKIEAIKIWRVPTFTVSSFLRFTGYYRCFIKNFASIVRPFNDLLVGHGTTNKKKS